MTTERYFKGIRQKISNDELEDAVRSLHSLLDSSPALTDLLLTSDRHGELVSRIKTGNTDFKWSSQNKIEVQQGLLDLINFLELVKQPSKIEREMHQAISITSSKNVVVGSTIDANDVHIGDKKFYSESKQSKKLRLFLFVFVPVLAITVGVLYYQVEILGKPLNLKVLIENKTKNPYLDDPVGILTLSYGGEDHSKNLKDEASLLFENIPSNFKDDRFRVKFEAEGFVTIDTSFSYQEIIEIPVRRNSDYALLQGYVFEEESESLVGIENVKVSIGCCSDLTDASGHFRIDIPFEFQQKKQRLEFYKEGYQQKSTIEPVLKNVEIRTYLNKK